MTTVQATLHCPECEGEYAEPTKCIGPVPYPNGLIVHEGHSGARVVTLTEEDWHYTAHAFSPTHDFDGCEFCGHLAGHQYHRRTMMIGYADREGVQE